MLEKPVDMWSLGCLAYILLSGKHPFFERDTSKMFLRVAAGDCEFKPESCWDNTSDHAKVHLLCVLPGVLSGQQPWRLGEDASRFGVQPVVFLFICRSVDLSMCRSIGSSVY